MMWMNEAEIDDMPHEVANWAHQMDVPLPRMKHAADVLVRYKDWINQNSDGWPYWSFGTKRAEKAMDLLQAADQTSRTGRDVTDLSKQDVTRALSPIRKFLTERGVSDFDRDRIAPLRPEDRPMTSGEQLEESVRGIAEQLDEIADDPEKISDWLDDVLEIRYRKGTPFVILLGFGGPNIWIEHDTMTQFYTLHGAWGSNQVEATSRGITAAGEYALETMEEISQ